MNFVKKSNVILLIYNLKETEKEKIKFQNIKFLCILFENAIFLNTKEKLSSFIIYNSKESLK